MADTNSIIMLTITSDVSNKWMSYKGDEVDDDESILEPTNIGICSVELFGEEIVVMVRNYCHNYFASYSWGNEFEQRLTHERITLAPDLPTLDWIWEEWDDGEEVPFRLLESSPEDFKMTINSPRCRNTGEYFFGGFEFETILNFFIEGFKNKSFDLYDYTNRHDKNTQAAYVFTFTFPDGTKRFFNISGEEISLEVAREVLGWK